VISFSRWLDVNSQFLENQLFGYSGFRWKKELLQSEAFSYMKGLQAHGSLAKQAFPGHGDTETDSHLCTSGDQASEKAELGYRFVTLLRAYLRQIDVCDGSSPEIAQASIRGKTSP